MSLIDTRPGYFSPRTDLSSRQNPNKSLSGLLFHLLGEEVSGQSFAKYLASLSPEQHQLLETKTGGHLPQFRSLARETKSDVFARELLQLGLLLQGDGHGELAGRIYHSLGGGDEAFAGIGDAALREQARQCLEHLKRGSLGSGMEATFRSVVHGSTDLPAVLTMGALGPVFRLTRAVTFARLAGAETVTLFTQGVGLRAAAYLSGFMAESLVYTASSEIAGVVSGNAPDSNLSFFGKWAGGALMLGGLKAVPALLGLGASWAGSASLAGRIAQMVAPSVGQVSGMLLGNGLQAVAGLRELGSGAAEITDAVTGALHCYVGGRIIGRRFGFMEAMEKGVELQVAQLEAPRLPKISPSGAFGKRLAYAGEASRPEIGGEGPKSPQDPHISSAMASMPEGEDTAALHPLEAVEGYAGEGAVLAGLSRRAFSSKQPLRKSKKPRYSSVSSETPPVESVMMEGSYDFLYLDKLVTRSSEGKDTEIRKFLKRIVSSFDHFSQKKLEVLADSIGRNLQFFFRVTVYGENFLREVLEKFSGDLKFQLVQEVAVYLGHFVLPWRGKAFDILCSLISDMSSDNLSALEQILKQDLLDIVQALAQKFPYYIKETLNHQFDWKNMQNYRSRADQLLDRIFFQRGMLLLGTKNTNGSTMPESPMDREQRKPSPVPKTRSDRKREAVAAFREALARVAEDVPPLVEGQEQKWVITKKDLAHLAHDISGQEGAPQIFENYVFSGPKAIPEVVRLVEASPLVRKPKSDVDVKAKVITAFKRAIARAEQDALAQVEGKKRKMTRREISRLAYGFYGEMDLSEQEQRTPQTFEKYVSGSRSQIIPAVLKLIKKSFLFKDDPEKR